MTAVTIVHLSDLHFGYDIDLAQVAALEALIPSLRPDAIVLSGDVTQRARHGEFQRAQAFVNLLSGVAPVLVVPGNHDVRWWLSPLGIRGEAPIFETYQQYFGAELSPRLEIPGAVIAGALTAHGVSFASMTWNLNDIAVKGHLPESEVARVRRYFESMSPGLIRIVVTHHNVLRGAISHRMGLSRWRTAQERLVAIGADLVLCGHDHQEAVGQIDGTVVVSTSGTHTGRTRGGRPSAFNLISADERSIGVQHLRWDREAGRFIPSDQARYGRVRTG